MACRCGGTRRGTPPRSSRRWCAGSPASTGSTCGALRGTGPGGLILRADVERASRAAAPVAPTGPRPADGPPPTPTGGPGAVAGRATRGRIPLTGIRRRSPTSSPAAAAEIPDATSGSTPTPPRCCDAARGDERGATADAPVGRAGAAGPVLPRPGCGSFPELNAQRRHRAAARSSGSAAVHLGFAAQTDRGLLVPVVRDAHALTTARAGRRAGRDSPPPPAPARCRRRELTGGTFTLNNYGVFGVDGSTPIINHPEAAMLGVGRIVDKPWVVDGRAGGPQGRPSSRLTFDHRVCDGGVAGGFLRHVADCVEQPGAAGGERLSGTPGAGHPGRGDRLRRAARRSSGSSGPAGRGRVFRTVRRETAVGREPAAPVVGAPPRGATVPYQGLPVAVRDRRPPVAGAPLWCNAHDYGLTGDGVTNDQPALAALVDRLGAGYAADGRARVICARRGSTPSGTPARLAQRGVADRRRPGRHPLPAQQRGPERPDRRWRSGRCPRARRGPRPAIADCTFADFEIDGSGVAMAEYNYLPKASGCSTSYAGVPQPLHPPHRSERAGLRLPPGHPGRRGGGGRLRPAGQR